nr:OmpA family protein [Saprospiraceae bacterium]
TDSKGTDSYNQTLSERRAKAVRNYLASNKVSRRRMDTIGYGETVPAYGNDTEANMAKNRRVEFLISANKQMQKEAEKEATSGN